jgi:hypothetical protein
MHACMYVGPLLLYELQSAGSSTVLAACCCREWCWPLPILLRDKLPTCAVWLSHTGYCQVDLSRSHFGRVRGT